MIAHVTKYLKIVEIERKLWEVLSRFNVIDVHHSAISGSCTTTFASRTIALKCLHAKLPPFVAGEKGVAFGARGSFPVFRFLRFEIGLVKSLLCRATTLESQSEETSNIFIGNAPPGFSLVSVNLAFNKFLDSPSFYLGWFC